MRGANTGPQLSDLHQSSGERRRVRGHRSDGGRRRPCPAEIDLWRRQGAVDFVGAAASFAFAFGALRKAGQLVSVGLFGGATPISPAMIAMKAVTVTGSYVGTLDEMREVMRIARSGVLPELPTATRPLAQINEALADLRQGRVRGRIVIVP